MARLAPGLYTFLAKTNKFADGRVYPLKAKQGVKKPYITYQRIALDEDYTHAGFSGLSANDYQINCWGKNAVEARVLADKVRRAISGFKGMMGNEVIQAAFIDTINEEFEEELGIFRVFVDVTLWQKNS